MKTQQTALIELIPPAFSDRQLEESHKFYEALHHMLRQATSKPAAIVLTLQASTATGLVYLLSVPKSELEQVMQVLKAYFPEIVVRETMPIALPSGSRYSRYFKLARHMAYPLQSRQSQGLHDPLSYVASALSSLKTDEVVTLDIRLQATHSARARSLLYKMQQGQMLLGQLRHSKHQALLSQLSHLLLGLTELLGIAFHSQTRRDIRSVAVNMPPSLSPYEQTLQAAVHSKLRSLLFKVQISITVWSETAALSQKRVRVVSTALAQQSDDSPQMLVLSKLYRRPKLLLSPTELAILYHFPLRASSTIDGLTKTLARTLAPPTALRDTNRALDIYYGENQHHTQTTAIGLTTAERQRHVYIVGGTGNGKTTLIQAAIVQDMSAGKGLAVIDPHGDLVDSLLDAVPSDRVDDVIYLNPDDLARPIAINLLELPEGLSGDDLLREKDSITESTISIFRKFFSDDDSGGHRIEYVLRNTIQTALCLKESTLFTVYRLLTDLSYQRIVADGLDDQDLVQFWRNEMGRAGDFQRVKMSAGITAKIGRFLFSASARRMLEHPKSTINFDDILASNKLLLCNVSKGLLGEDTSSLIGTMVLAKLQLAALRRVRQAESQRTAYHVYVDEFQNFATTSFVQMLSEARKYKLFVTMAEQSTAQQAEQRLVDIILANVGTVICFRSGSPADEQRLLPLFQPWLQAGEIANLPSFCFYMRLVAVEPREPFSGKTLPPPSRDEKPTDMKQRVIEASRLRYGRAVEKSLEAVSLADVNSKPKASNPAISPQPL